MASNALELARNGVPKKPFYVPGQAGGKAFSVHAEGERVILTKDGKDREEVDLVGPEIEQEPQLPRPVTPGGAMGDPLDEEQPQPPGASSLDEGLKKLVEVVDRTDGGHES